MLVGCDESCSEESGADPMICARMTAQTLGRCASVAAAKELWGEGDRRLGDLTYPFGNYFARLLFHSRGSY